MRIPRQNDPAHARRGGGLAVFVLLLAVLAVAGGAWFVAREAGEAQDIRDRNQAQRDAAAQRELERERLRTSANPLADVEGPVDNGRLGPQVGDEFSRDRSYSTHPLWQQAVDQSVRAFEHLEAAERLRNAGNSAWRPEAKQGKTLLEEALRTSNPLIETGVPLDGTRSQAGIEQVRHMWRERVVGLRKLAI
jgi:hypothetical protein